MCGCVDGCVPSGVHACVCTRMHSRLRVFVRAHVSWCVHPFLDVRVFCAYAYDYMHGHVSRDRRVSALDTDQGRRALTRARVGYW